MQYRNLASFKVNPIGLGCMNLSHAYGKPADPKVAEQLLLRALDLGVNLFDTAALYGFGANETLIGKVLAPHRQRFMLASKCGMQGVASKGADGSQDTIKRVIDGRPETLKRTCEDSLRRLRTDVIDLYYLHRWDKNVPIEDSVGALADLVRAGKIRHIGLSEVSAHTLRRAHAVHPIAAVQTEYSLWTRNPEIALLQACQNLGIALVAFSPVARGFLTGALRDVSSLSSTDLRQSMPRFSAANFAKNLQLLQRFEALAKQAECSPAQLALAWLLKQGEFIIPIPGTTNVAHLEENMQASNVAISTELEVQLNQLINQNSVAGARYSAATQLEIDTEEFIDTTIKR